MLVSGKVSKKWIQAAEQRNAEILKPPPMVDLTPDVINNKSIDCVSTVRNNKVYTNCN